MKYKLLIVMFGVMLLMLQACVQHNSRGTSAKSDEEVAQLYTDLGLGYLRQGKLDLSLTKLKHALEIDKNKPDANHYIAEIYKQMDEFELAEKHYAKAIILDKENPMLLNNYGAFLCGQSRFEDAEKYFLRAVGVKRYRTPELAFENLALCAQRTDNVVKAEEYFRKALGIRPELAKSLFQMSGISYKKQDYMRARAFLQRFHSVVNETEQSLKLGIKIERALEDELAVKKYQQQLREKFPHATAD
jgi:type IV pilus assembly protein PilF